jgi:hypothetical protein
MGAVEGSPYWTEATWVIGYVRASPVEDRKEIEEVSLAVTAPAKLVPSFSITVAFEPATAGAGVLLHPAKASKENPIRICVLIRMLYLKHAGCRYTKRS